MPSPTAPGDGASGASGQSLHLLAAELHSSQAMAPLCRTCPGKETESSPGEQSQALACLVFSAQLSPPGHGGAQRLIRRDFRACSGC